MNANTVIIWAAISHPLVILVQISGTRAKYTIIYTRRRSRVTFSRHHVNVEVSISSALCLRRVPGWSVLCCVWVCVATALCVLYADLLLSSAIAAQRSRACLSSVRRGKFSFESCNLFYCYFSQSHVIYNNADNTGVTS